MTNSNPASLCPAGRTDEWCAAQTTLRALWWASVHPGLVPATAATRCAGRVSA